MSKPSELWIQLADQEDPEYWEMVRELEEWIAAQKPPTEAELEELQALLERPVP